MANKDQIIAALHKKVGELQAQLKEALETNEEPWEPEIDSFHDDL